MAFSWRIWVWAAALALTLGTGACSSGDSDDGGDSSGDGDGDSSGDGDGDSSGDGDGDSSGDGDGDSSGDGDGDSSGDGDGDVDNEPVGDDLTLLFNPMYSAYDGVHDFQLPAIVQGVQDVDWSARPADAVDLAPDSETGGVMITMRQAGEVQIIARAGNLSGSATLYITDATPEDWELGEQRYNNEIPFPMFDIPDGGFMPTADGGMPNVDIEIPDNLSCRNCHGAGAEALDVEHTPQQTGGYSDDQLKSIFTMGMKPEGSTFHTPFPPSIYEQFHTWDATDAEKKGIVVYLRSLTPKTQGTLDFSGLMEMFQ
jgi:hypothetical protein